MFLLSGIRFLKRKIAWGGFWGIWWLSDFWNVVISRKLPHKPCSLMGPPWFRQTTTLCTRSFQTLLSIKDVSENVIIYFACATDLKFNLYQAALLYVLEIRYHIKSPNIFFYQASYRYFLFNLYFFFVFFFLLFSLWFPSFFLLSLFILFLCLIFLSLLILHIFFLLSFFTSVFLFFLPLYILLSIALYMYHSFYSASFPDSIIWRLQKMAAGNYGNHRQIPRQMSIQFNNIQKNQNSEKFGRWRLDSVTY